MHMVESQCENLSFEEILMWQVLMPRKKIPAIPQSGTGAVATWPFLSKLFMLISKGQTSFVKVSS